MSSMSSGYDGDIESQQQVLLITSDPPRDPWRWIFLILQARQILISRADKAKKSSIPSYGVISSEEVANLEIEEVVEVFPPQVSGDVYCDGTDDSTVSDIKLQHANIDRIVKKKDLDSLLRFGGVQGIAEALDTDLQKGIPGDEDDLRSRSTINPLSKPYSPTKVFFQLLLKSCNNSVNFLLFVSAMMSIGFGIEENGMRTGWHEGAIIFLAIVSLVFVPSIRDYWYGSPKRLQEDQRWSEKKQKEIVVLRGGTLQTINSDVVIGDIVCLRKGNRIPGDGLFISGGSLKLDDGSTTINEDNPFLYHGAKVVNGHARMLVTSVGMNTSWNELMSRVTKAPSKTPLPTQLDRVSSCTQKSGLLISILIPIVVFLHYKLGKEKHKNGIPDTEGRRIPIKELMDAIKRFVMKPSGKVSFLTTSLTMLVVGMVEGVPFIISLSIFYWNKKALRNKALARESLACVGMGSVTTICTDKIGGLTLNQQEVGMCWLGEELITEDSVIDANVLEAFFCGISTDVLMQQDSTNSLENPILSWATLNLGMEMELLKQSCTIFDPKAPKSNEGGNRVLLRKEKNMESSMYMHWQGPAKKILAMCSHYYDSEGTVKIIDEEQGSTFEQVIENMHSKNLQIIAFAYKQVDGPPFEDNNLIIIGLLGLKYISRTETRKAMDACRNAGVNVVLISEDKTSTLTRIGAEYGLLLNSDGQVLEGEVFRNYSDVKITEMVDKICGIGNCLPLDKLKLVQCLKQKGHKVAMVGVTTNDTAAIKEANVGITMGTWSSESARESSDIIIWDGNFSSLVMILSCGRCTYSNIQKYIQLELTMVISGLLITIITTIAFGDTPFTAIQWCWVNVVVAILGGLALLTEQPSEKLMDKPPINQNDSFITKTIWRNIITQASFQSVILVTFQVESKSILKINDKVIETMIFNSFILCQVFNQFNSRHPHTKNMLKGIHRNIFFWVSVSVTVGLQALFIEIAHIVTDDAKLNGQQWGICFLIGTLSLPIDLVAKLISCFIMNLVTSPQCSESAANLELPLINQDSTANP